MEESDIDWRGRALSAARTFATICADLKSSNPNESVLDFFINTLVTELWDNGFSQSEIRSAFAEAIADMPRYAAGQKKRG
jgi:hypothetical protein